MDRLAMRIPLETYLSGRGKVYSLVVSVPYSPIDIDLGHLSRGLWNPLTDRFRVWYLPKEPGMKGQPSCYVMVRKFDPIDGVLLYCQLVVNIDWSGGEKDSRSFTIGIMSNDEVRARSMLNSMLEIPPSYHRRSELKPVEKKWREDSDAVMRFLANIHSAMAQMNPSGKVYTLKFEPPKGVITELKRNMGAWW